MYPEVSLFLKKISNLNCTMLIELTVTELAKASWQARKDTFPIASHFQGGENSQTPNHLVSAIYIQVKRRRILCNSFVINLIPSQSTI